jgi:hypothetical protein
VIRRTGESGVGQVQRVLGDGQLVQEHLAALVWMGHLHTPLMRPTVRPRYLRCRLSSGVVFFLWTPPVVAATLALAGVEAVGARSVGTAGRVKSQTGGQSMALTRHAGG